jgi:hypothetical protein
MDLFITDLQGENAALLIEHLNSSPLGHFEDFQHGINPTNCLMGDVLEVRLSSSHLKKVKAPAIEMIVIGRKHTVMGLEIKIDYIVTEHRKPFKIYDFNQTIHTLMIDVHKIHGLNHIPSYYFNWLKNNWLKNNNHISK